MPASTLTRYKTKANRIMKAVKTLNKSAIGREINESPAVISYRVKKVYPNQLYDWIRILDMAGYEIREKEDGEI